MWPWAKHATWPSTFSMRAISRRARTPTSSTVSPSGIGVSQIVQFGCFSRTDLVVIPS
jgi:hypothetical protein